MLKLVQDGDMLNLPETKVDKNTSKLTSEDSLLNPRNPRHQGETLQKVQPYINLDPRNVF